MEKYNSMMEFQYLTKEDLQLLATATYGWTKTNFQVIELNELNNVSYHGAGERVTLIINVNHQWNAFIKDENNKTYIGYTDPAIRDYLKQQLKDNSFKKPRVVKINNHGISALIYAKVVNDLLDAAQTVTADVVKLDTTDLRFALKQCLEMIRGIKDKFASLCNQHFKMTQRNQPSEKKTVQRNQPFKKEAVPRNQPSEKKTVQQDQSSEKDTVQENQPSNLRRLFPIHLETIQQTSEQEAVQQDQSSENEAVQQNQSHDETVDMQSPSPVVQRKKKAIKRPRNRNQEDYVPRTPWKVPKTYPRPTRASVGKTTDSLRVVIRNNKPMNCKEMKAVLDCIIKEYVPLDADGPIKLQNYSFEFGGSIVVKCANPETLQWLMETTLSIQPWPGAEIASRPEMELHSAARFSTYIPYTDADSVERVLCLIREQYPELCSEQWWVLSGSTSRGVGYNVTFAMSEECAEALLNAELSVTLGITTLKFRRLADKSKV